MSTNLQSRHSWQLAHNHFPYYHVPANYYDVPRNIGDHTYEDPYLWAATNNINGYYYRPTSEYIDGVFVTDDATMFRTNMQSSQAHNHPHAPPNHYRNSRNSTGNHFAPHNNSDFPNTGHTYNLWNPNNYQPTLTDQFIDESYVTTDDVNQLIETMQNLDRNFGSRLSGQLFDYRALLDLGDDDTQVGDQEENLTIMLKTRSHCAKVEVNSEETVIRADDREEICTICQCEYVNDETIGTLECGHEYHASCIEQWLLRGKQNCPICRSSVLPS